MRTSISRQSDLKYINMKKVYDAIKTNEPVSRKTIADVTGLSTMSVGRMITALSELGMIHEAPGISESGSAGRPTALCSIVIEKAYCLSIDIEADNCRMVIADLANRFVVFRELTIAQMVESFDSVASRIKLAFGDMLEQTGIPYESVKGCGLSLGAHVDYERKKIVATSQFKWHDVDAGTILEKTLGIPVMIENDCKAAIIGESALLKQSGREYNNIVYLELGRNGVGSAVIINGQLLRGSRNAAGEIGHVTLIPDGDLCNCGRRGCFETVISENSILRNANRINPSILSVEDLVKNVSEGDMEMTNFMKQIGEYIAIAINDLSCAYNPDIILLNGSVVQENLAGLEFARQSMEDRILKTLQPELVVSMAKMGNNASLYGIGCAVTDKIVNDLLKGII